MANKVLRQVLVLERLEVQLKEGLVQMEVLPLVEPKEELHHQREVLLQEAPLREVRLLELLPLKVLLLSTRRPAISED